MNGGLSFGRERGSPCQWNRFCLRAGMPFAPAEIAFGFDRFHILTSLSRSFEPSKTPYSREHWPLISNVHQPAHAKRWACCYLLKSISPFCRAASATIDELAERAAWASANQNARHIQVEGTGHWLHWNARNWLLRSFMKQFPVYDSA